MTQAKPQGWPQDAVEVGRILGAYGVKGWIKVQPFSFDASALFGSQSWCLSLERPGLPAHRLLKVLAVREQGEDLVAQVEGVDDRTQAEQLRGGVLSVSRAAFPKTPDGEYYWLDLIGLTVRNLQDQVLGQVIGLIDTGPHAVFRIAPPGVEKPTPSQEVLIPFVSAYVQDVDLAADLIRVDWVADWAADGSEDEAKPA